jgi:hypothetical protein
MRYLLLIWDYCERSKWVCPLGLKSLMNWVFMFRWICRWGAWRCGRLSLRSLWTFQVSLPLGCITASVSEITCELGIVEFRCFCRWGACDASAGVCPWDHCERSKWVCRWGTWSCGCLSLRSSLVNCPANLSWIGVALNTQKIIYFKLILLVPVLSRIIKSKK